MSTTLTHNITATYGYVLNPATGKPESTMFSVGCSCGWKAPHAVAFHGDEQCRLHLLDVQVAIKNEWEQAGHSLEVMRATWRSRMAQLGSQGLTLFSNERRVERTISWMVLEMLGIPALPLPGEVNKESQS